ncbi:MAG: lysine--tRNA ligase [Candidatus Dormibacteraceae bacterium]
MNRSGRESDPPADPSSVLGDRRAKLNRLQAAGVEVYAREFQRTHTSDGARLLLGDGERTDPVRLAGRLMVKRPAGGLTFADLQDSGGRIQLMARRDRLGEAELDRFNDLDPGDLVGVEGPVLKTRRGEVSVEVASFRLLTKSLRPLPEKWHGLKDVETRYRQRYLDLIANPAAAEVFTARSRAIAAIRRHLDAAGFLEVETPVLQEIPGGGNARPFLTHHNALDRDLYLRIALELHLKRLVVGGMERVYELSRVFRNEGLSPRHNPEFTMLECYQAYATYEDMMELTEALVVAAAAGAGCPLESPDEGRGISLRPPYPRRRMVDLVLEVTGRDLVGPELFRVYEEEVEATVRAPTFVLDYPVEVSPLARRRSDDPRFVERFELIVEGREVANAFTELTDPLDQRRRFEDQAAAGRAGDREAHPMDEDYLRALEHGLPPTGGLGVGVDRLVMLLTGQSSIRDVILFPQMRPEPG